MKKGIPLGIMNYRELKEKNYYVVDKSLLIQEFLERMAKATLVTRPRRFGKTLNMSRRCPPMACLPAFLTSRRMQKLYSKIRRLCRQNIPR